MNIQPEIVIRKKDSASKEKEIGNKFLLPGIPDWNWAKAQWKGASDKGASA